ncbi:MAG TPA: peptidylprolyl isomerase [Amaricoccus sp.]|uniref:peptidylprolyl isomerase n=1 Tax=Amaricoccus sp. TaxID=1872485 RepID=UPI002C7185C9|nr:peptidylprolyl isomerase [Amaricoccus sp.]HMQ92052.1 peptidylprolyl isomerase [Amaricoccus sp.]HMR51469.1 peptidylprolyl isomerase [Amaricoccus sp.]HMR59564.1 peptidylprolyl isomerase [Amaricoccus sp.]HMT98357.1 peptidylprolyl isomerase [Amaricoccus sp.]
MSAIPKEHRDRPAGGPGLAGRILREPLLHFLLIGMAVFLAFGLRSEPPRRADAAVIEVTPAQVERLSAQFEAVWRRPPGAEELRALVEDFVREEVYYREAQALGLDRDDTVIRRRLRQKMEFLADSGAGAIEPGEGDLRDYYTAHLDRFTRPERASFRQVFLGEDDPAPVLAALSGGADPSGLGHRSLLPETVEAAGATAVDGTFGDGFFAAVTALEPGAWHGPVASAFGAHLVRLDALEPAQVPGFDQVRKLVDSEWRQQAAEDLREAQFQAMRRHYEVVLPPIEAER